MKQEIRIIEVENGFILSCNGPEPFVQGRQYVFTNCNDLSLWIRDVLPFFNERQLLRSHE